MISVPGYILFEKIHESPSSIVFRGLRVSDKKRVILKSRTAFNQHSTNPLCFENEYELSRGIEDKNIVKCVDLIRAGNLSVLVFDDIGGVSLDKIDGLEKIDTITILKIASGVATAIDQIHSHEIIHNAINPAHIIWNRHTEQINIIDFGLSGKYTTIPSRIGNPDKLTGALPYISPEQTCRTNHDTDYRTDMYSLGVTLYQMLTGKLPFSSDDPLELIHGHIAGTPIPPHDIRSGLPEAISLIIEKLMAKTPKDRYQSMRGFLSDLYFCISELEKYGKIEEFTPGLQDFSEQFLISPNLYGRENEIHMLSRAYERILQGGTEIVAITGRSGIGKTFLMQEFQKSISGGRCYFISGKFDQFRRTLPYASIIDALSKVIGQILTGSHKNINRWKKRFLNALGENGQVIIDCLPDLELIIGKQPPRQKLPPEESRNHLHIAFLNLIRAFTSRQHPLVIFLDDMQWVDNSTLALLQGILEDARTSHLLVMGAFRDNNIDDLLYISATLNDFEKSGIVTNSISLEPLCPSAVNRLIADTLQADNNETIDLSEKMLAITGENTFFIKEFLKALYKKKAVFFDRKTCRWQWYTETIHSHPITDNMIDLMLRKIDYLSPEVKQLLMLASCLGKRFSFQALLLISLKDVNQIVKLLWQAVREELIIPVDKNSIDLFSPDLWGKKNGSPPSLVEFKFVHDRVQETIYGMFSDKWKKQAHLRIALLTLTKANGEAFGENIFEIVNHLNIAESHIHDPDEKLLLARLNLEAGQKAMQSSAHDIALSCFSVALKSLPEKSWTTHYDLTRAIHMGCAQSEYLNGLISLPESRLRRMLDNVCGAHDKVEIHIALIRILHDRGKHKQAVKAGINALELLKYRIPLIPGKKRIFFKRRAISRQLKHKTIEVLANLPRMKDTRIIAIMETLGEMTDPAMIFNSDCAAYINLKMLEITLNHGNSKHSAHVYSTFGAILAGKPEDYNSGYAYGTLALSMLSDCNDQKIARRTRFSVAESINHWKRHAITSLEIYKKIYKENHESECPVFAGWTAVYMMIIPMITGRRLSSLNEEIKKHTRFIKQVRHTDMLFFCQLSARYVTFLEGASNDRSGFCGDEFADASFIHRIEATCQNNLVFAFFYMLKIQIDFLAGQYGKALETANRFEGISPEIKGLIFTPEIYFYWALSIARVYPGASRYKQNRQLRQMKRFKTLFKNWADHCGENFFHKYILICAETARITGRKEIAHDLYQQSIQSAKENLYTQNEAIANECRALFYTDLGERHEAKQYWVRAHSIYRNWGAFAKARRIEADFPFLSPATGKINTSHVSIPTPTDTQLQDFLDWRSMSKTFRAISREIDLSALMQTMMKSIIENAGAQRGVLILIRNGELFVEAEIRIAWEGAILTNAIPLAEFVSVPADMINYAALKTRSVILGDARAGHPFSEDPYFIREQKKSVLCSPIVYQGKLKGIIYLENNAAPRIFTKDRVFAIETLSSQAAISLENAILYKRLKESESNYRSIFENAVEGIFQITRQGTFISLNQSLANILGFNHPDEIIKSGTNVVDLFFFDSKRKKLFVRQLSRTGQIRDFEGNGKRKDGGDFWVSVSVRACFDTRGKITAYEGSVVDISERKQIEEAVRQREAAEASARAKSVFLASMSHEIRTPLTAIIGLSEVSHINGIEGKHRSRVSKINYCASMLLRTIDDILHFSKFEAGRVRLENIDFTISEIITNMETMFIHQTAGTNIELTFMISNDIPPVLTGDPLRLTQVLTNLTGNAFKFTKSGRITIGAKCLYYKDNIARLHFFVSDTGIGICENTMPRLFEVFFQGDNSVSRHYGGTGLGLAISKSIVNVMNGRIWAKNNPGRGATFHFEINTGYRNKPVYTLAATTDAKSSNDATGDETDGHTTNGLRLLYVDDNTINREITAEILENSGYIVETASSGGEAVKQVIRNQYSAILMDVQMPGMDGFETTRTIRGKTGTRNTVIIGMSAHVMPGYREQCIDAGMTDYIPKPVDIKQLHTLLSHYLPNKAGPDISNRDRAIQYH